MNTGNDWKVIHTDASWETRCVYVHAYVRTCTYMCVHMCVCAYACVCVPTHVWCVHVSLGPSLCLVHYSVWPQVLQYTYIRM